MNLGDAGSALPLVLLGIIGGALLLVTVASMNRRRRHVQGGLAPPIAPPGVRRIPTGSHRPCARCTRPVAGTSCCVCWIARCPSGRSRHRSSRLPTRSQSSSAISLPIGGSEISDVVTSRLKEQTQTVADGLWSLADRIVVADRVGSLSFCGIGWSEKTRCYCAAWPCRRHGLG